VAIAVSVPVPPVTTPRDRLLDAARRVLDRNGLDGLTLRAIAREAGVSHGAPLRHFSGLGALLAALSAEGFHQLVAAIEEATAAEPEADAARRLSASGVGYIGFACRNPGVFGVMFRPELCDITDPGYQAAAAASFQQLVDLVEAAQAEGWQTDHSSHQLAAVLWAQVHGLAQLWLHGALRAVVSPTDLDAVIDLATRFR
jgi:AcrR family transcriptional regulator